MVDGVPGNPAGVRELARHWLQQGQAAQDASGTLRTASSDIQGGTLRLQGDFAPKLKDAVGDLPDALDRLATGYRGCGTALGRFADRLEQAQAKARTAQTDRDTAMRGRRNAEWDLDSLAPGWDVHADNPTGLRAYLAGKPEPAFQAVTRREEAVRQESLAEQLQRQAAQLRGDAEKDCARDIENALEDSGLKNRSWWQKAGDWLTTTFTTWDGFVKFCEQVSLVLGVVALFLTGPLALIVGAILLIATLVIVADKALKLARGEMSWKEAAFELGMVVLSRFGGRALGPALRRFANTKTITALSRAGHRGADKLMGKLNLGDTARNLAHRGICKVTGHPVDIATGKVFTVSTDLELEGPLPFAFERIWYSTSTYRGPLGHGWHHTYDAALVVTRDDLLYRTPDGRHLDLLPLYPGTSWFDRQERITLSRDEAGVYRVDDSDCITRTFRPPTTTRDDEEPAVHVLASVGSRAGHRIDLDHDEQGRLTRITDSAGRELVLGYEQGRVTELTAPHPDEDGGRFTVARYHYDELGNLTAVADALGQERTYEYDRHLLTRETDRSGLTFAFAYDADDERARCLRTWGTEGLYERRLTYATGLTTVTDSLGRVSRHEHDAGLVTHTVDANGGEVRVEYEDQQIVLEIDELGHRTTAAYDHRGNLLELTGPDGSTAVVTYDERDNPLEGVDQVGGRWVFGYDERGLLTTRRDPLGRETGYAYARGLLTSITDPAGGVTTVDHDEQRCPARVVAPGGVTRELRRDRLGRVVTERDPLGNETHWALDLLGRPVTIRLPDGNERRLTFGPEGELLRLTDRQNDVAWSYRAFGRIATRTQGGTTVGFEYDTELQLLAITNELGRVFGFGYGPTGRLATERSFGETMRIHEYDLAGRPVSMRAAGGRVTRYGWDVCDRLVRVDHTDGEFAEYAYRADGELMSAANAAAVVRFERDLLGSVIRESRDGHWVAGEFDALGHRVRLTSSLGADQVVGRDTIGRVTSVATAGFAAGFTRDALGQELTRTLPGGVTDVSARDGIGRLARRQVTGATSLLDRTYDWGFDDRLLGVDGTRFAHDPLGRLRSATRDGETELRMPDAVGSLFRTAARDDRVYGPAGELLENAEPGGGRTRHTYDADGNLVSREGPDGRRWLYRWGSDGTLREVLRPDGELVTFAYDALGRRIAKTFAGRTTRWVWDLHVPLHEWTVADDLVTWVFEPGTFSPMARLGRDGARSIVGDHLGDPVLMLDEAGAPVWSGDRTAWGELRPAGGPPSACPFRWAGQYEDDETGLHYNRFRYYDPVAGQYLSPDPIGLLGDLAVYGYVADPTIQSDPFGLDAKELAARLTGAGRPLSPGQTAHHMVKENAGGYAAHSRDLLARQGIEVDDPENGARLWGTHPNQQAQPAHPGRTAARAAGTQHGGTHVHGKANDKLIYRILRGAEKKGVPVGSVLEDIGRRMESGNWKSTATGGCYGP